MINLIPNSEKKKMIRDFYFRFITVLFSAVGLSLILVIIALTPAYFFTTFRENLINESLVKQENTPIPTASQQAVSVSEELDRKISLINSFRDSKVKVSEQIISEIILNKLSDIRITQIQYSNSETGETKVLVRGNAPSRERLLLFRIALEDSLAFDKVDLPISNFVRGSNIEFSLNILP